MKKPCDIPMADKIRPNKNDPKKHLLDERSKARTNSLFFQTKIEKYKPLYTINNFDHDGCISLRNAYLEMADPTEFAFAEKYFYDYAHWKRFSELEVFKPVVEKWREELDLKLRSDAIRVLVSSSVDLKDKSRGTSAKFLATRAWENKKDLSRAARAARVKNDKAIEALISDDLKRISK